MQRSSVSKTRLTFVECRATFPGVCAVVPAAGFGRRMQTECPKQYLSIG
ncbi:2-C-methyl-D-erythritol 4-phosphate cytidylyltransferase, partial [Klebsiella pneumoniae]